MSATILTAIKTCGGSDAFHAFKLSNPDSMNSSYTVSDVSVTESFVGYIYTATIRVTHKLLFVFGSNGIRCVSTPIQSKKKRSRMKRLSKSVDGWERCSR